MGELLTVALFTIRDAYACLITLAASILVFWGIVGGHASLPGPPLVHILVLIAVITLLAYLEGLQVAILVSTVFALSGPPRLVRACLCCLGLTESDAAGIGKRERRGLPGCMLWSKTGRTYSGFW
jgi:hypothetical protein